MNRLDWSRPMRVHIVGIGGAGMSAIASILAREGHRVSGSDLKDSPVLDRLRVQGIEVHVGHHAENIADDVDVVVISTAIPERNVEVQGARARDVPVCRRADALAAIAQRRRTVAISGTAGKTTTASMTALILRDAGYEPTFLIGGDVNEVGTNAFYGEGDWLVVEADESDGTFIELGAEAVLVTNIEADHLDYWGTFDRLVDGFRQFIGAARGPRVVCADDPVTSRLAAEVRREAGPVTTFGFLADADYRVERRSGGRGGSEALLWHRQTEVGALVLPVPGRHNVLNAAGAAAMALELGVPFAAVQRAIGRYAGVARRFHFRGEIAGATLVDDYAHLPGKVRAAISTAAEGGWSRVIAVFQPHRYTRTEALAGEFGLAFEGADVVVVTDVYAAGEAPRPGVSGLLVYDAVRAALPTIPVEYVEHRGELARRVHALIQPGDVVLTIGAGDVTSLADELLRLATVGPTRDTPNRPGDETA